MAQLSSAECLVSLAGNSCAKPIVLSSHSGMRRTSGPMPVAAAINGSSAAIDVCSPSAGWRSPRLPFAE